MKKMRNLPISLVHLFINEDPKAVSKVYEQIKNLLFFVITTYVKNQEDAKDVFQETLLAIWKEKESCNPHTFVQWAVGIAKFQSYRLLKKKQNDFLPSEDMDSCGSEDSEPSLFNEIAPYLSADECSVLVFKFEFGMTIRDIGKVMGVPKSSVQDIYKKALEKTKRHLEKGETS